MVVGGFRGDAAEAVSVHGDGVGRGDGVAVPFGAVLCAVVGEVGERGSERLEDIRIIGAEFNVVDGPWESLPRTKDRDDRGHVENGIGGCRTGTWQE